MVSFDDRSLIADWCDCRLLNARVYLGRSRDLNDDSLKHLIVIGIFDDRRNVGNDRLLKSL